MVCNGCEFDRKRFLPHSPWGPGDKTRLGNLRQNALIRELLLLRAVLVECRGWVFAEGVARLANGADGALIREERCEKEREKSLRGSMRAFT